MLCFSSIESKKLSPAKLGPEAKARYSGDKDICEIIVGTSFPG